MSKFDIQYFRVDTERLIRVRVRFDMPVVCDKVIVQFVTDEKFLEIVSTSVGVISKNNIIVSFIPELLEVFLRSEQKETNFECLISYLKDNDLVSSETLTCAVKHVDAVIPSKCDIKVIKTKGFDFQSRLDQFVELLGKRSGSVWRARLYVENEVKIHLSSKGKEKTFAAFGPMTAEVSAADYIFTLDPQVNRITIPNEIIWKYYPLYVHDSKLYCFELVKPDFHRLQNIYYKNRISNLIELSELPKKKSQKRKIEQFYTPMGKSFDNSWKISDLTELPILKSKNA